MGRVLVSLAALAAVLGGASSAASARTSIVQVPLSAPQAQVPVLQRLGLDLVDGGTRTGVRVVLHGDRDRRRLAAAGFTSRRLVSDLAASDTRARRTDMARAALSERSALPSGRDTYRTLDDYENDLTALANGHPGLVRRFDLPVHSVQGRPISGVEIASNVDAADDGRPTYIVMGLIHAREWPAGEVAMEFATDLAANYGTDARITSLLDHVRVIVLPVTNPDGFQASRSGTDDQQRTNADGVDLNRNFGAYWGGPGAGTAPAEETYRGTGPWSEPESQAIHQLSQGRMVTGLESLHNFAALVLRPPGFSALGLAPDEPRLKSLGDAMAAATGYTSEYGYQLYEVTGATEDWNYVAQNTFGYTIELASKTNTFHGDYQSDVVDQYLGTPGTATAGKGVREALLLAGEEAEDPTEHSIVQGTAPAGRILRLQKSFTTLTSPICTTDACTTTTPAFGIPDGLNVTTVVPASGHYVWHINPSTRPFVRAQGQTEAWTMTCEDATGHVYSSRSLVIGIGQQMTVNPCDASSAAAAGGGTSTPGGGGAAAGSATDHTAPALSLAVDSGLVRTVLRQGGIRLRVRCSEKCRLGMTAKLSTHTVASSTRSSLTANKRTTVLVHLTRTGRTRLKAHKSATLRLSLVARDAAGNHRTTTRTIHLH